MPLALIHLVSEQMVQNLLPTLALRPDVVVQVRTSDPRFKDSPEHLSAACHVAGLERVQFLPPETIPFDSPTITQTSDFLDSLCERLKEYRLVFNLTGGTKLMSIGAYRVAQHRRIPSLYTDTQNSQAFVAGETGDLSAAVRTLSETAGELSVPVLMAAHGRGPERWTSQRPSDLLRQFGSRAAEIRAQGPPAEFTRWT